MLRDPGGSAVLRRNQTPGKVGFTEDLRQEVREYLAKMHELYRRQHTPKVRPTKSCNACSLKELCVPKIMKTKPVGDYLRSHLEDEP